MLTLSGTAVFPDGAGAGKEGVPTLEDIGTGLGRIVRFAGQVRDFYTVLAHTLTVASLLPPEYAIFGLMHDVPEMCVSDVPSPWKSQQAKELELQLLQRINQHYGLPWPIPEEAQTAVEVADYHALVAEGELLGYSRPEVLRYLPQLGEPPHEAFDLTSFHLANVPQYVHPEVAGPIFAEAFSHYSSLWQTHFEPVPAV